MADTEQPIEQEFRAIMNGLAVQLDLILNGSTKIADRKTCFVLLIAPFDGPEGKRTNYISNGGRKDVTALLEEVVKRFKEQGAPSEAGN